MLGLGTIGEFAIGQAGNVTAEIVTLDKWFAALSEPRVKTMRGLLPSQQQAFIALPAVNPIVSFSWFLGLSEPRVKVKTGIKPSQQQFLMWAPLPDLALKPPFGWFSALSEPSIKTKRGLRPSLQQFFAMPPRLLPTPTITGTLRGVESGDTALFGITMFGRPVNAMIGVIELAPVPYLGIIEMPLTQGVGGVIEDRLAPASGSAAPVISDAAVSIRII